MLPSQDPAVVSVKRLAGAAAGGMRQLPTVKREAIITEVRKFLSNKTLCPFYFEHDYARVISGEEEGIYGWTAINFLLGR